MSPSWSAEGRYHHGSFTRESFAWPSGRRDALNRVMTVADFGDCYVVPALGSSSTQTADQSLGGSWAWADVDGELDDRRRAALADLFDDHSFVVSSGSGFHVYVSLGEDVEPARLADVNRALRDVLDADAKWQVNSLLRLPGTWWYKEAARGGARRLVQVVDL